MQSSQSEIQRKHKKNKGGIVITKRTIPDHLIFSGLPKNEDGRYTRFQYVKPMARYLPVKHPENYGLNEKLIKMCTPEPENTFEKELEDTIAEIEDMFSKKVTELQNMMQEAGIENLPLLE
ncbi:unnamed protein product [Nezara viridula]|uniref:Uncharacterized protein n=1 Tax=Nezara viridula TaxID=85310 RepID=A0A9P0HGG0_NEZVI|nr:unnamed protein product [Nezara viridula]